jgi:hypothetical protein
MSHQPSRRWDPPPQGWGPHTHHAPVAQGQMFRQQPPSIPRPPQFNTPPGPWNTSTHHPSAIPPVTQPHFNGIVHTPPVLADKMAYAHASSIARPSEAPNNPPAVARLQPRQSQQQQKPQPLNQHQRQPQSQIDSKDLDQKKKERDQRERERKEREKKQKELEFKKEEAKRIHAAIAATPTKEQKEQPNLLKKESEFISKLQFRNTLPDIPFDPKLLILPFDNSRYVRYNPTSLEKHHKHVLFNEPDLGIPINVIDPDIYKVPVSNLSMAPEDTAIINAEVAVPATKGKLKGKGAPRSRLEVRPAVSWLRKTEYLSNEEDLPRFKGKGIEARPGLHKLKADQLETLDVQVKAVEEAFDQVKRPPVHPINPTLIPIEVLPVFPDFTLWPTPYTEVLFDSDPLFVLENLDSINPEHQDFMRNRAIIRGIPNAKNLVAFITPSNDSRKRKRLDDGTGDSEEYQQIRALHFDVSNEPDLQDNFFFVFTKEAVYYNQLSTKLKLRNVLTKEEKELVMDAPRPSHITLSLTELDADVKNDREARVAELLSGRSLNMHANSNL